MSWVQESSHKREQLQRLLPANAHSPEMFLSPAFTDTYMALLLADQCLLPHIPKNKKQSNPSCVEHVKFMFSWVEASEMSS